jgi:hypothetical protein
MNADRFGFERMPEYGNRPQSLGNGGSIKTGQAILLPPLAVPKTNVIPSAPQASLNIRQPIRDNGRSPAPESP